MSTKQMIYIPGYEGMYMACESGFIWSIPRYVGTRSYGGYYLSDEIQRLGYHQVLLSKGGKVKAWKVHRLICMAFHGLPSLSKMQVNHIDGNRGNNMPSNLEWVTSSQNKLHGFAIGISKRTSEKLFAARSLSGKRSRKLSLSDALAVKIMKKAGYSSRHIASMFDVVKSTIAGIVLNKTYRESFNV